MIAGIKIVVLFYSFVLGLFHPVHVTVASIEFNEDNKRLITSIKLFEDDFRLLFYHLYEIEINLKDSSHYDNYQHLIIPYFDKNFVLKINKQDSLKFKISNWKIIDDDIWFYFESDPLDKIDIIEINNTLLLDLYFDQKNLVIIKTKTKELGYQFDYKTTRQQIPFD